MIINKLYRRKEIWHPLKTTETTETETLGLFMSLSPRFVIGLLSATYVILQAFVSNKPSKYNATLFINFSSYRPQTTCLKHSFLLQILPLQSTCALLSPSFRSSFFTKSADKLGICCISSNSLQPTTRTSSRE